jgi:type IV pilus assembly protein PilA
MKKNNKGFTLIELLAVIVVLAIIMVIATQQINKTISRTRANSMISTLKMAANGVKTKQADGSIETCNSKDKCLGDVVDYDTDDYTINVTGDSSAWKVTVTATSGGEFERADFNLVDSATDNSDIGKTHVDVAKVNGDKMPTISCYVDSNGNITATSPAKE